ncbi:MAG: hypothetical protein HY660_18780 [Armatimonadetes bacterium]|nr:hypothetical protein [Armatimonadota bacterium]
MLATIAGAAPPNLVIAVWDNEQWAETGGQPSHTARGADLAGIARASGIPRVETPRSEEEFTGVIRRAMRETGPWVIVVKVCEEKPEVRPPVEPVLNKSAFMAHVRSLIR